MWRLSTRSAVRASVAALALAACIGIGVGSAAGETAVAGDAGRPRIAARFELLGNLVDGESRFRAVLELENRGPGTLGASGWALYFNFLPVPDPESLDGVTVEQVNGDLRRLAPTARFGSLEPGERRRIVFTAPGWLIKESDAPAGLYLVFDDPSESWQPLAEYVVAPLPVDRLRRTPEDRLEVPSPASRHAVNARLVAPSEPPVPVVPTPRRYEAAPGRLTLDGPPAIGHQEGLAGEAALLAEDLARRFGSAPRVAENDPGATIRLALGEVEVDGRRSEAYRLHVDPASGIEIVGADPAGVFYGIQTLRALLPLDPDAEGRMRVAAVRVEDAPRFGYRGLHLDVARNFQSADTVERLIDVAATYKLNRFHFHLTDDEGWRLPVGALPELVEVGGRRGHTVDGLDHLPPSFGSGPDPVGSHGSGAYSRAELVDVLRYATRRHVEVVPEIDVPGHARAAIRAMEARAERLTAAGRAQEASHYRLRDPEDRSVYRSVQGWDDNVIDVCLPSTYRFLETVVDEIVELWAEAGAPLSAIHTGGDEVPAGVWEASPACRRLIAADETLGSSADLPGYFLARLAGILKERGLVTAGWEEIALEAGDEGGHAGKRPSAAALAGGFRPYVWNNVWGWGSEDVGYRLANAGFEVVLANATNLYFDLAYDKHPAEPGYGWAGFVDTRTAWELAPFDLYLNATHDKMGNPIDPATFADHERLSETGRKSILGIQGQIWGENARGRAAMEYLALPKLLGLAERAWAERPAWVSVGDPDERRRQREAAWSDFAHRLGRHELPRLDRLHGGFGYRLPPPGAVLVDGVLSANVAYPGLEIRYTVDGGEPTARSPRYDGPVAVDAEVVRLRTFDRRGRGSRTALVRPQRETTPSTRE